MADITFNVLRYDPDSGSEPHLQAYRVPLPDNGKGLTVLDGLNYILENLDGSLAFRSSCRAGVCGSCAMHINGKHRLACNTQVASLKTQEITIRPLAHLEVEKDLCVNMDQFWEKHELVRPYLVPGSPPPEKERIQSQEDRKELDMVIDCIQCASCYSACPITLTSKEYIGPAALLKIDRYVRDTRDGIHNLRIEQADGPYGAWRCHNVFACQCCPKELDPPRSIAHIKRRLLRKRLLGKSK
ncbi:MAG: succinate dehydrogenase iron-sulfur subunit [Candidatus Brocadiales bacterium]|nr:succinate dehydrogenase iron-sulfur subunit [Candidatus Bathyanammoxibius amoris]